jgi:hypothetical protein
MRPAAQARCRLAQDYDPDREGVNSADARPDDVGCAGRQGPYGEGRRQKLAIIVATARTLAQAQSINRAGIAQLALRICRPFPKAACNLN